MSTCPFVLALLISADEKPGPKIPLNEDSTDANDPLAKDGYVDSVGR